MTVACGTEVTIPPRCDRQATMADWPGGQPVHGSRRMAVVGWPWAGEAGAREVRAGRTSATVRCFARNWQSAFAHLPG